MKALQKNGLELVDDVNMDQYDAPKQFTPQVDYINVVYNRLSQSEQRHALHMQVIHIIWIVNLTGYATANQVSYNTMDILVG